MSALDIIGENLELRLQVRFCALAKLQGGKRHAAVGLLRIGPDDDAALHDTPARVVEHGPEHFATRAIRNTMINDERAVGVLTTAQ